MRWQGRRQSSNVQDRRGRGGRMAVGGGIGTIIIVVLALLFGGNPMEYINVGTQQQTPHVASAKEDELAQFVKVVLADTEDVWHKLFSEQVNSNYKEPQLVLFTGSDQSGCGFASAATGPFYCPMDKSVLYRFEFLPAVERSF